MDAKLLAIMASLAIAFTGMNMIMNNNQATDLASEFQAFKGQHSKVYNTIEEEAYRFAVFTQNKQIIAAHNAKYEAGESGFFMGVNQFADLTNDEFRAQYTTYKPENKKPSQDVFTETNFVGDVDWNALGKVQKVKNQGSCGSCWAFSTAASCESLKAINGGAVGDFSEQQLVDCSGSYGNQGCNGGLMDDGFAYYKDHGICTEESYSYEGKDGTCKADSCTKDSFTISGFTDVAAKSTDALKAACDKQPVSIAVDAGVAWQLYFGGVMRSWECGKSLDHGVLLAGYNSDYWLVKNSWGSGWGISGYIHLEGDKDTCGLADQASFPK